MIDSAKPLQKATLFGLAAVLCWSTVATAFKLSLEYLSPVQLILIASIASTLFLVSVLLIQKRLSELWAQPIKVYLNSFLFGLLNPTLYYLLLFWAYELLPAQEAQAINYSWAIVMSLLAVPLLGQKLHWFDLVAAGLCYFGVCIIATRGNLLSLEFSNLSGVFFAILSTIVWSLYWIFSQKDKREPVLALCLNFLCTLPVIAIAVMINDPLRLTDVGWQAFAGGIYIGVFEMGLAFILWLAAMKRAQSIAQLANLIFLSPFLSLFLIWLVLKEAILSSTIIGLILILGGLFIQNKLSSKQKC